MNLSIEQFEKVKNQATVEGINAILKDQGAFKNASQFPVVYYGKHICPGLARYNEDGKDETILIRLETLQSMAKSFIGKPVYLYHQEVDLENIDNADGFVIDCNYNEADGWFWSKFIVKSDPGIEAIEKKAWTLSNAYIPRQWGAGGSHINVPYDREVLEGEYTHLAIVPDPRYEGAQILNLDAYKAYNAELTNKKLELVNSKKEKGPMSILNMFNYKKEKVENADEITDTTMIDIGDGHIVSFAKMAKAVSDGKEAEIKNAEEEEKPNADSEVDVDGEKMPLKDLISRYNKLMKKNMDDDEDKKNAEEEAKKKEEEEKAAANKNDHDGKYNMDMEVQANGESFALKDLVNKCNMGKDGEHKNSKKYFNALKNARSKGSAPAVETGGDMLKRGQERYGSTK